MSLEAARIQGGHSPIDWDHYFMGLTIAISARSQDPSSKFGALLVDKKNSILASGYNGIPRGIEYRPEFFDRPDKYMWFVHAEQNAIFQCAARGVATENSTMYVQAYPCIECMKAIIQAGVTSLVVPEKAGIGAPLPPPTGFKDVDNWRSTVMAAVEMMHAGGVKVRSVVHE